MVGCSSAQSEPVVSRPIVETGFLESSPIKKDIGSSVVKKPVKISEEDILKNKIKELYKRMLEDKISSIYYDSEVPHYSFQIVIPKLGNIIIQPYTPSYGPLLRHSSESGSLKKAHHVCYPAFKNCKDYEAEDKDFLEVRDIIVDTALDFYDKLEIDLALPNAPNGWGSGYYTEKIDSGLLIPALKTLDQSVKDYVQSQGLQTK
jgi:hypothetical protein